MEKLLKELQGKPLQDAEDDTVLWTRLAQEITQQQPGTTDLWSSLKQRLDLTKKKPRRLAGVEVACQPSTRGDPVYVLKSPLRPSYLKLDARDYTLFEQMDGEHTVRDLAVAYFVQFQAFPFDRLVHLLEQLKANGLLEEKACDVFGQVTTQVAARRLAYRLQHLADQATQMELSLKGGDRWFDALYRRIGHLLFTPLARLVYLLLTPLGLALFIWLLATGAYPLLTAGGSYALGLLVLTLADAVMIVIHECGHGMALKFYGRHIPKTGLLFYFGSLAFFVDATDAWMASRRSRMVISFAGPFSTILVGCLLTIVMVLFPGLPLNPILFQAAFMGISSALLNLLPLLECDGYFVLMDWLEIPMLRQKALAFVRGALWGKLVAHARWSHEEWILTCFGLLTAITTGLIMISAIYLWQSQVTSMLGELTSGRDPIAAVLAGALTIIVGAPLVLGLAIRGVLFGGVVLDRMLKMTPRSLFFYLCIF